LGGHAEAPFSVTPFSLKTFCNQLELLASRASLGSANHFKYLF